MPKKKAKRKVYFGQEVQDAIIEYNESNNNSERNQVYQNRIHKAFDKLATFLGKVAPQEEFPHYNKTEVRLPN